MYAAFYVRRLHHDMKRAKGEEELQLSLQVHNTSVERAFHVLRERLKKTRIGSGNAVAVPDPVQNDLTVTLSKCRNRTLLCLS